MNNTLNATIRAIIEALTEFIPVSSTGHLFLFSLYFPFQNIEQVSSDFEDLFDIFIQSGAILSVVVLYFKELLIHFKGALHYLKGDKTKENQEGLYFYIYIFISCLPIMAIGFLFRTFLDGIKQNQYLLFILGIAWLLGGFIIIFQEYYLSKKIHKEPEMTLKKAFWIGIFQCVALIPGVSRALATIIGARSLGFSRKKAAEYSFFLAIPVLTSAGLYKLIKYYSILEGEVLWILVYGSLVSFVLCLFVIRLFLAYIKRFSYNIFGYYRILLGIIVLLVAAVQNL